MSSQVGLGSAALATCQLCEKVPLTNGSLCLSKASNQPYNIYPCCTSRFPTLVFRRLSPPHFETLTLEHKFRKVAKNHVNRKDKFVGGDNSLPCVKWAANWTGTFKPSQKNTLTFNLTIDKNPYKHTLKGFNSPLNWQGNIRLYSACPKVRTYKAKKKIKNKIK